MEQKTQQRDLLIEKLSAYLPNGSVDFCADKILEYKIHVKITKNRASKHADYRPPMNGTTHKMTFNYGMNPFRFLIVFIHELAHLKVWNKYRDRVYPHGIEWGNEYKVLMNELSSFYRFPPKIEQAVNKHMSKPLAAGCCDLDLTRVLNSYDIINDEKVYLEELNIDNVFRYGSGDLYQKGEKLRKRYRCLNLQDGHNYLFDPLVRVELVVEKFIQEGS